MARTETQPARPAIRPRLYLGGDVKLGPGKIDLLRLVAEHRSISAAARAMDMSYKRAWQLIDSMNRDFGAPVVTTSTGGRGGGGASLTDLGRTLLDHYAALETRINAAADAELVALRQLLPLKRCMR